MRKKVMILILVILIVLLLAVFLSRPEPEPALPIPDPDQYSGVIVENLSAETYSYKVQINARRILSALNSFDAGADAETDAPAEGSIPLFRFIFANGCGYGEIGGSILADAKLCIVDAYEEGFRVQGESTFYPCGRFFHDWCESTYEGLDTPPCTGPIYLLDYDTNAVSISIWTRE